jgi:hypothetical protein
VNTNQKKYNLLVQILFFVLPFVCLQNSFGVSASTVSFNGETVIKITDTHVYHPTSLMFEAPGNQKITIENHLQKDLDVGNIYFVGDEFTAPHIGRDIHTDSASGCSIVKSGTSCSFVINAAENASPSINNDSELLMLNYRIYGEQKDRFAQFKLKLDYNNDVIFKIRNLEFKANEATWMELYHHFKELTIINNNSSFLINVKNIRLPERSVDFVIGDYKNCSNLKSHGSCEVAIGTNFNTIKNDVVPIYVTYDLVDADGMVIKKDLIATAAAIVNYPSEKTAEHVRSAEARVDGAIAGASIVVPYAAITQKFIKKFFVVVLPRKAGIMTDIATGFLAGGSYFISDKIVESTVGDYESSYYVNKIFSAATMHGVIAFGLCSRNGGYGLCAAATIGCGLLGTFGGEAITDALYSNVVYHLPEQSWYGWLNEKSSLLVNFASTAAIRVTCKTMLGVPNGGFTDVYQDTLSASVVVALDSIFKEYPKLQATYKNSTDTFTCDDHSCGGCTCTKLPLDS